MYFCLFDWLRDHCLLEFLLVGYGNCVGFLSWLIYVENSEQLDCSIVVRECPIFRLLQLVWFLLEVISYLK